MKHWGTYLLLAVLLTAGPTGLAGPDAVDPTLGGARTRHCILLGIAAGLSLGFGNYVGFIGTLITADRMGCI